LDNLRGQNREDIKRIRTEPNTHKKMTPPSTQNLKTLGLWVFFLLYVAQLSHSYSMLSGIIFKYEYLNHKQSSLVPPFTHLNGTRLPETSSARLSIQGSNCTRMSRSRGKIGEISQEWDKSQPI